jgi:2-polyprenyl-6-methoxyphenol hydroxylase-like FAD-dependent oxidoreductase
MNRDVVIVGGGPVGLMLATELRLAGVDVTVLERLLDPTGFSKALGLGGRSVDMLDHRGLLERFSTNLSPIDLRFAHFGGIPLDVAQLGSSRPRFLPIQQARVEQLLEERAYELGAKMRWGHELTGLQQDEDGVTIDVRDPNGDYQLRTRFLVGCDGGHSIVRKLAGIAFPGLAPTVLNRLGDVTIPAEVAQPTHYALPGGIRIPFGITRTATMSIAIVPLGSGIHRVVVGEPYPPSFDRSAPMTLDELQASVRRAIGADLPMSEPRWLSRFTDASRQAERYRAGRVLLAGDAAHVHLPAGGPGLNTGLQDAVNLGWKLAAEVQGWAPAGLLDTYHAERHPVGARVLMHTRAQGVLLSEDERVLALRELFRELLEDQQTLRHIVDMLQGTDIHYDMDGGTEYHPLLGRWAPDLTLVSAEGATCVAQLMHRARGVLLDLAGRAALRDIAAGWTDRVDVVAARCEGQPAPADALLIRPDGYVAWVAASGEPDEDAQPGLRRTLATWFGARQLTRAASG